MSNLGNIAIGILVGIFAMCVLLTICPGLVFPVALVAVMLVEANVYVLTTIAVTALAGYVVAFARNQNRLHGAACGALLGLAATVAYVSYVVLTARF